MLLNQFILLDLNFVISLTAALVFFAISWLYFDASRAHHKRMKEITLFFGFLFLAISFVAQAITIDQTLLAKSLLGSGTIITVKNIFRILAYLTLIVGQLTIPLQSIPEEIKKSSAQSLLIIPTIPNLAYVVFAIPILSVLTGFLYLRRAIIGLENHLKPISLGFFLLSVSELFNMLEIFRQTSNYNLSYLVGVFGPIWILEQFFLLLSVFIFGRWIWGYLLKRFDSQIFMILTTLSLVIFLVTTVFFTFATLSNLITESYNSLKVDSGVLSYAIESKKAELISSAQTIAKTTGLGEAASNSDKTVISELTSSVIVDKKVSSLVILGKNGEILYKAEDPQFSGGSMSGSSLIKKTLAGEVASGIQIKDGPTSPVVQISASAPIFVDKKVAGVVLIGFDADCAFTDGLKAATGLDTSIYAGNVRSATTLIASDGKSRYVGIKEENTKVKRAVLSEGKNFAGPVSILNVDYFANFSPLVDTDGNSIGMLFVGRPQVSVVAAATSSLELTFLVTITLLIFSLGPSYFIAKSIANQVK